MSIRRLRQVKRMRIKYLNQITGFTNRVNQRKILSGSWGLSSQQEYLINQTFLIKTKIGFVKVKATEFN